MELFFFFTPGQTYLMFTGMLGRWVASAVLLIPKPFGGADSVSGQLCEDKECPFNGATNSGRVWSKVPESDVLSVLLSNTNTHFALPSSNHCFPVGITFTFQNQHTLPSTSISGLQCTSRLYIRCYPWHLAQKWGNSQKMHLQIILLY